MKEAKVLNYTPLLDEKLSVKDISIPQGQAVV